MSAADKVNKAESDGMSTSSKVRTNVWELEGTLMDYWSKGMIAVGTPEQKSLAAECAVLTGLTYMQIKDWIGNHKKKIAKSESAPLSSLPSAPSYSERRKCAKDIFYSKIIPELSHLPPSERLGAAANEWKAVRGTDDAAKYVSEAQGYKKLGEVKDDEHASLQLGIVLRKKLVKLITEMEKNCEEVAVLSYGRDGHSRWYGTAKGLAFLNSKVDLTSKFPAFVGDKATCKLRTEALRKQVCELFNSLYGAATGEQFCSYKKIAQGYFSVLGMPDKIAFCHPRSYGKKRLLAILENSKSIKFCRVPLLLVSTLSTVGVSDQLIQPLTSSQPLTTGYQVLTSISEPIQAPIDIQSLTSTQLFTAGCQPLTSIYQPIQLLNNIQSETSSQPLTTNCQPFTSINQAFQAPTDIQSLTSTQPLTASCQPLTSIYQPIQSFTATNQTQKRKSHEKCKTAGKKCRNPVYAVEALLDERKAGRRTEYCVKWKDFDDSHNSWEPRQNILDSKLIDIWNKKKLGSL